MRSGLSRTDIQGRIKELVEVLFVNIPSGVENQRKQIIKKKKEERRVLKSGAKWAVEKGFGSAEDLDHIEEHGCIEGGDPDRVSEKATERGRPQLGTLGSGNHFVEVGYVAEVFDETIAQALGLWKDQATVIVHTGSRGLGHQVCDDYIRVMLDAARKYQIELPDPPTLLCPCFFARREAVSRGNGLCSQFRFHQSADDHPLGEGDL